eukprot:scaffold4596_cov109-Isochrysis_galbana.AAC.6
MVHSVPQLGTPVPPCTPPTALQAAPTSAQLEQLRHTESEAETPPRANRPPARTHAAHQLPPAPQPPHWRWERGCHFNLPVPARSTAPHASKSRTPACSRAAAEASLRRAPAATCPVPMPHTRCHPHPSLHPGGGGMAATITHWQLRRLPPKPGNPTLPPPVAPPRLPTPITSLRRASDRRLRWRHRSPAQ